MREVSVLVQKPDDRFAEYDHPGRGGKREERGEAHGADDVVPERGQVPGRGVPRDEREVRRRDRHAEQPDRKLDQAKRVLEDRDGPVPVSRGELAVHHHGDLRGRQAHDRGEHEPHHSPQGRGLPVERPLVSKAASSGDRNLDRELADRPQEGSDREREHGRLAQPRKKRREQDRADDARDVEDRGRGRRDEEPSIGVEDTHHHGGERHEEQERRHHPRHRRRQLDLAGRSEKARRERENDRPRKEQDQDREDREHDQQRIDHAVREPPGLPLSRLHAHAREGRDERRREGALGEQVPQEVRDPERDVEGVGLHSRAEQMRDDHLPTEAEDPADERRDGDGHRGADEARLPLVVHGRGFCQRSRSGSKEEPDPPFADPPFAIARFDD